MKVRNSKAKTHSNRGRTMKKGRNTNWWDEFNDVINYLPYLFEKAGFAIGDITGVGKNLSVDPKLERTFGLEQGKYDVPVVYNPTQLSIDKKYLRQVVGTMLQEYMDDPKQEAISFLGRYPWRDKLLSDMLPSVLTPASQERYNSLIGKPNTSISGYNPQKWEKVKNKLGLGLAAAMGAASQHADAMGGASKNRNTGRNIGRGTNPSMYKHMNGKPQPLKYATPFKNKFSK